MAFLGGAENTTRIEKRKSLLNDNEDASYFPSSCATSRVLGWRFYFTGRRCRKGHLDLRYTSSKECRLCRLIKNEGLKDQQSKWSALNKNRKNALSRQHYYDNHQYQLERTRAKWAKNSEAVRKRNLAWINRNPGYWAQASAKRRAALLRAIPPWADLEAIKEFYSGCPPGYHVDHIHPLQGKTVCGFHVLENLQYLPASENLRKFNRLEPDHVSA